MADNQNFFPNQGINQPAEVHTMPDKFISPGNAGPGMPQPKKASKASWIIIAVIILAALGILGGASYLIYTNLPSKETAQVVNTGKVSNQNANAVVNSNLNTNKNGNSNANINANKNSNANKNANQNANANTNANANVNSNANSNTNTAVEKAADNDIDGLTNEEEKIFGTKVDKPDTDEDGYKDGAEVINGYNPMGIGTLTESDLVGSYDNSDFNYFIIYPKNWIVEPIAEDNKNVVFTPNDMENAGEFIEVITDTNPYGYKVLDWYLDQNSEAVESQLKNITAGDLEGVLSVDGYTAYFTDDNYVYAIHYNYGSKKEVNFSTMFQIMYKNFELLPAVDTNQNTNSNANVNTNINSNTND